MTFFSSKPSILSNKKAISILLVSILALCSSNSALANCKTSDVAFYLEKGFTNEQVVQLCGTTQASSAPSPQQAQYSQAQFQQAQQASQLQQDLSFLTDAFVARNVSITNNNIVISPEECVSSENGVRKRDREGKSICLNTTITINRSGMTIAKASKGFFISKPSLTIRGNIQRELTGISRLTYRGDKNAVIRKLPKTMNQVAIETRRGVSIQSVANRLAKYRK